jgi:gentisate 1,2-dioxygenase
VEDLTMTSAMPHGASEGVGPADSPAGNTERAELYAAMGAANIQALWTQAADLMPRQPKPRAVPWLWRWETVLALAARAGRAVAVGRGGERRALALANPGLAGLPFATATWHEHHSGAADHEAAEPSDLFVLSDAPVLEALRLDRTEVLKKPQEVTGVWSGG